MKKITLLLVGFLMVFLVYSQSTSGLPSVEIKSSDGTPFNTKDIDNDGKPIIISFWALWCKPCITELNAIADVYEDWQEETGVKLYAVSIDDGRNTSKIMPFANGNDWDYEILLDQNSDFKRAMNFPLIPHTFILDGNKNIVWQHSSFAPGGEQEVLEVLRKITAGEKIEGN